ncbi:hypothetical protein [Arthrobacter sedimenti]|uniref:Secreted protein n=1 Tax=Arthrobacter sedimenti TaxID=2694931 RepID=A0ABV8WNK6_9MICC
MMRLRCSLLITTLFMTLLFMARVPMSFMPVVVLVELVGNVILRFHQVLLEFFFGITAPPCRVPQLPGRLRTPGIQVGGPLLSCLLCRRHPGALFFPGVPAGVLGALAVLRLNRP